MCGDVLEHGEGGVGLERLRDVLGALGTHAIAIEAASESQHKTLLAADSKEKQAP